MLAGQEKKPVAIGQKTIGLSGATRRLGLPPALINPIQSYFKYDFSPVQVEEAPALAGSGVAAVASGNSIQFAPGKFSPSTSGGRHIIAHEFAHLAQQARGQVGGAAGQLLESPALERSAQADAAQVFCSTPKADTPLAPYHGAPAPVQPYRLVQPVPGNYTQGVAGAPMFSTNQVVHYPQGGAPAGSLVAVNAGNAGNAGNAFTAQDTGIDGTAFTALTAAMAAVTTAQAALAPAWQQYYAASGRLSEPQQQGNALGQQGYLVVPAVAGTAAPAAAPAADVLTATSEFKARRVTSNAPMPLLVSENDRFAVNAAYPEPKEAYAQAGVLNKVQGQVQNDGSRMEIRFILTGNSVTLNLGTAPLVGYKPVFVTVQPPKPCFCGLFHTEGGETPSEEAAERNACDDMRNCYYPYNAKKPDSYRGDNLDRQTIQVPWCMHTAGVVSIDGGDSISVENGARRTWLLRRGGAIAPGATRDAVLSNFSDDEMNKTWYFRMYGPANLEQDIKQQTEDRFR